MQIEFYVPEFKFYVVLLQDYNISEIKIWNYWWEIILKT